jgi:hypothetical protein
LELDRLASATGSADPDTECGMGFEVTGEAGSGARAEIARLRLKLLADWLGCDEAVMAAAIRKAGSVDAGIEALRKAGNAKLRPIDLPRVGPVGETVATFQADNRSGPMDSWRPWLRKRRAESAARHGREAVRH